MAFSGIKKADITTVGFDEEKIYSDLINFNISTIEPAGAKTLDFHLNDYLIRVDTSAKKLYIDDIEFSFKDKTSFYYNKKKKVFK
ncbi:hypothetical protein AGMMS49532_03210 [Endomicrobiia bacterium]|nr:hypothetical protein AGMMS49532_03210 [Endomicrobiia bacterium]